MGLIESGIRCLQIDKSRLKGISWFWAFFQKCLFECGLQSLLFLIVLAGLFFQKLDFE